MLAAGERAGLVGDNRNERRQVAVVHLGIAPLGNGPDALVAVGRHDVKNLHLALGHVPIGLAIDEAQIGPPAVDRIAINRAVAIVPVKVAVLHGLADLLHTLGIALRLLAEQSLVDDLGQFLVALFREMDA